MRYKPVKKKQKGRVWWEIGDQWKDNQTPQSYSVEYEDRMECTEVCKKLSMTKWLKGCKPIK